MRRVLFLCTGNSCRSQMAEAIVNARLSKEWWAFSAGTEPSEYVHSLAIRALSEIGIEHEGESKHVNKFRKMSFDLVITVCGDAEEKCPIWLGSGKKVHIGFDDPADAIGSDEEKIVVFRRVRDEIEEKIIQFLESRE
ncbi:MAG: arsenate reductase ArsC [Anaerolineae bacterium]|jgi:arsenate reductase (thioredoxin)|nr:arsenate reductase ArsC [Anaerolineae bacterium]MBT3713998.1 arsenate reductase ArsC [Anaerolineae bacterium]MBT4311856.1 arsenate reductase ArsC [Anaerolineae bacterium]MBT4458076.1 arsenate reductase ArsC [Anaerolineae bacterium]MBT4842518.1 arsenate reductase ArsC [Anaerolineae bacterium]